MLMKGSIIAACEGNRNAARDAKRAARLVLDGWPLVGFGRTKAKMINVFNSRSSGPIPK